MRVRVVAKLAEVVDGIDLSGVEEGDVIDIPDHHGTLLIAEKWAEFVGVDEEVTHNLQWPHDRDVAADQGVPRASSPADTNADTDDLQPGPFTDLTDYRP